MSALAGIERQPISITEERGSNCHWTWSEPLIRWVDGDHRGWLLPGKILVCLLLARYKPVGKEIVHRPVICERWRWRRTSSSEIVDYGGLVRPPRICISHQDLWETWIAISNPGTELFGVRRVDNAGYVIWTILTSSKADWNSCHALLEKK